MSRVEIEGLEVRSEEGCIEGSDRRNPAPSLSPLSVLCLLRLHAAVFGYIITYYIE